MLTYVKLNCLEFTSCNVYRKLGLYQVLRLDETIERATELHSVGHVLCPVNIFSAKQHI